MTKKYLSLSVFSLSSLLAFAAPQLQAPQAQELKTVLAEKSLLDEAHIKIIQLDEESGLAIAKINSFQESILMRKTHENGRCGGFETLAQDEKSFASLNFKKILSDLNTRKKLDANVEAKLAKARIRAKKRSLVTDAVQQVDSEKIKSWVTWLSAFPTRYHKGTEPNKHVVQLKEKLDSELAAYSQLGASTSLITHNNTPQKTLRLTIPGKSRAQEIVAMGAHLDSIKSGFFGPSTGLAPGADDDASGSSSVLEALRVLLKNAPYERTVEFFWYAGEEAGLLGSAETAQGYKREAKNVVGVLQLDMTLYPGTGAGKIASMTDFTSPELRQLVADINKLYLNIEIVDDKCGYGCSDHASWYRQGFPTVMPTEATFNQMNKKIHTSDDVINSQSSFEHAAIFSKIAVAFVHHLANP